MKSNTRSVTKIPATINPLTQIPISGSVKRRVCGYARVSSDSDEQFTSYEAQIDYYEKYIKSHVDWEFVKVYTDEGITGVMTKHRDGFNEMIDDALGGKLDLIVTKSVSRFARNTVDTLVTVRKLKEKGVEVFFEKEQIYTLDSKGELLITIMSSLAQEESRSISENVTWGQRKRFSDGKVNLPYKHFLGYEKGPDGFPKIIPEQAILVRRIYKMFMYGKTPGMIASILTAEGIPTPAGKPKWQASTVASILTNEKYRGSALLQKEFTVDFLTKKTKKNEGEVAQYYIEHSHEAIIDPQEWDAVQSEFACRKTLGMQYSGKSVLATKIVCEDCGSFYGQKVWHSNTPNRRVIWQCNEKFHNEKRCTTPNFTEEEIKEKFITVYNDLIDNKETILDTCRLVQHILTDCSKIDEEIDSIESEIEVIAELTRRCIEENASLAQNQEDFMRKYDGYVKRYETAKVKLESLQNERQKRIAKADAIGAFMFKLSEFNEKMTVFDEWLWIISVEKVIAQSNGKLKFIFKYDGEYEA